MAETYTGDEGDTALAAGMPVMDGSEKRQKGWLAINKTRDLIVSYIASLWPLPVNKGGTGANNATTARANLGAVRDAIGTGLEFYSVGFNRLSWRAPGVTFGTELQNVTVSSLRYKDPLDDPDVAPMDLWPVLREFTLKDGDGTRFLGYFAEDLDAVDDTRRFVVYATTLTEDGKVEFRRDADGNLVPDRIDYVQLLLAQVAQLNARVQALQEATGS